jgi:hypothetical protein
MNFPLLAYPVLNSVADRVRKRDRVRRRGRPLSLFDGAA